MVKKIRNKRLVISVATLIIIAILAITWKFGLFWLPDPGASSVKTGANLDQTTDQQLQAIAQNLDTPWTMAWLPNGDMLITERNGNLKRLGSNGQTYPIQGVTETSEGGLLGLALHPDFSTNNSLYLYLTHQTAQGLKNKVDQYSLVNDQLQYQRTILANIPAASNHNGGGVAFGPDGKLYITTGDAAQPETAQDTSSLAGKILRLNDDGTTPSDNPFNNLVWSYGHRNPQGITWDDQGRLWGVEHGPSGDRHGSGQDELNLIDKGANYGWPVIAGSQTATNMRSPIAHSGTNQTWAPSGIAFIDGSLYFAGLRGQTLYQAVINSDNSVTLTGHFQQQLGRLRLVAVHGDLLYFSTSNQDGRGQPKTSDDQIFRISPSVLNQTAD